VEDPESSPVVIASDQAGTANVWLRSVVLGLLAVVGVAVSLRAANLAIALATRTGPYDGLSLSSLPLAPEIVDDVVWAGSLLCAGVLLMLVLLPGGRAYLQRPIRSVLPLMIGVTGLFLGVSWVEPFEGITVLWFGFGTQVLLFVIALIPALYLLLENPDQRLIRYIGLASIALVLVVYLPSVIQPMWGVIDLSPHSYYIFNEGVLHLSAVPTQVEARAPGSAVVRHGRSRRSPARLSLLTRLSGGGTGIFQRPESEPATSERYVRGLAPTAPSSRR